MNVKVNRRIMIAIKLIILFLLLCLPLYADTENQLKNTQVSEITSDLAKLYVPVIVSLIILFITNLITLWKIRLDSKSAIKRDLTVQEINRKKEMLDSFYNPIFYLLNLNGELFKSIGPPSFPQEHHSREEAVQVWDKVVENAILPNNRKICEVINRFCHLLDSEDSLNNYFEFVKHAESYEVFRNNPNQLHIKFKYPDRFLNNVACNRSRVINNLTNIEKDIGKFISERNY